MGSAESIRVVAGIVRKQKRPVAVVVSAMTGVTNQLLESGKLALAGKAKERQKVLDEIRVRHFTTIDTLITRDAKVADDTKRYVTKTIDTLAIFLDSLWGAEKITPEAHDTILAVGERLSARLLAAYLTDLGVPSEQVDLERTIPGKFKVADGSFYVAAEKFFGAAFKKVLAKKKIPVGTGYFGRVPGGMLAAVGRGYSDFCGALVAASLRADCYEIWTDVSGVFTSDPRKIKKAKVVDTISFEAAAELAHFGAKVIHPQSVHPAIRANIPVWIKNTFKSADRGTEIIREVKNPTNPMTGITSKKNITIINIASYRMLMQYGFLAKIFEIFARHKTSIDVVSTSEVSVSVTIEDTTNLDKIVEELKPFSKISVVTKKAIVCLVGLGMRHKKGVAGEVFAVLGKAGISIDQISQGASEINITFVVSEDKADLAVATLHKKFFE